jgi:hypothetical protein
MANDSTPSFLANPLPIIAILMLAAGVLVRTLPLESGRGGDADRANPSIADRQDVPARLWQDPFSAVAAAAKQATPDEAHAPETLFERIRLRRERLRPGAAAPKPVQILGVMVSTSAFAEDAEMRRRTRYAVMSGLVAADYQPRDPEGLGYVHIPHAQGMRLPAFVPFEWFRGKDDEQLVVLWLEENVLGRNPTRQLATLLRTLCGTTEAQPLCRPEEVQQQIKIIGPGNSSSLQLLVREVGDKDVGVALNFNGTMLDFYSPLATSPHEDLWRALTQPKTRADVLGPLRAGCLLPVPAGQPVPESADCAVRIVRTIGGDDRLAQNMTAELALRGVNGDGWDCNDRVVIVAERDTTYGKELADQFRRALQDAPACRPQPGETPEEANKRRGDPDKLVWEFGYLRGLDGVVAGASAEKPSAARSDAKQRLDFDVLDAPTALRERAEGRGQFDYVRRLAAEIVDREKGENLKATLGDYARLEGRPKVKAIGVLGNDVYDKLLILQALHGVFPYAMYFTTDLDARLLHPDQSSWSRNLIVASNYGFALTPGLQGGTPPFRNGYQTAIYLATLLALQPPNTVALTPQLREWLRPQMYEIGRTQEIRLWSREEHAMQNASRGECSTTNVYACNVVHPVTQDRAHPAVLALLTAVLGAALLWFTWMPLRNFARRRPVLLLVILLAIETALIVGMSGWLRTWVERIEEPFTWFEGVSLWPSQIIFLLCTIYCIYWIQRIARTFSIAQRDIGKEFFAPDDQGTPTPAQREWWRNWCRIANDTLHGRYLAERQALGQAPVGSETWAIYTEYCHFDRYRLRALRLAVICFFFGLCLFLLGPQYLPFRGQTIWWLNLVLYSICGFALLLLVFQVVYITQMSTNFVRWIARYETQYPEETLQRYAARLGVSLDVQHAADLSMGDRRQRVVEPWVDFALIVRLTGEVDRYIYPPFVALALFGLAQIRVFDDWQPSPWMLAVVLLVISFAVWSSHILRREAEGARELILRKFDDCLLQNAGTPGGSGPCGPSELLKTLLTRVRETRKGAFLPFFQRPAPRAVLIPFGGLGGISILEYLLTRQL